LTLLEQAHSAFVLGVPLASLALMRSILKVALKMHYGSAGGNLDEMVNNTDFDLLPRAAGEA